jgi:exodeoxyribonuclease V alpha subunit
MRDQIGKKESDLVGQVISAVIVSRWRKESKGYPSTFRAQVEIRGANDPELIGKNAFVQSGTPLSDIFRRGVPVRLYGDLEKYKRSARSKGSNVIVLDENASGGITIDVNTNSLRAILNRGVYIQPGQAFNNRLAVSKTPFIADYINAGKERDNISGNPDDCDMTATTGQANFVSPISFDEIEHESELAVIYQLFINAGLPRDYSDAALIYETLIHRANWMKTSVLGLIMQAPWVVAQVPGIKVGEADKIAEILGIGSSDDRRIYAAVTRVVWNASRNSGDSYIPFWEMTRRVNYELSRLDITPADLRSLIFGKYSSDSDEKNPFGSAMGRVAPCSKMQEDVIADRMMLYELYDVQPSGKQLEKYGTFDKWRHKKASIDAHATYPNGVFFAECSAAEALAKLVNNDDGTILPVDIPETFEDNGKIIVLDKQQRDAMMTALSHRVTMWIGHAGSGKSTTIRALASFIQKAGIAGLDPVVLAPTGVAADRTAAGLGVPSGTIHRYAGIRKESDDLLINSLGTKGITPLLGSFAIVDEMIMCDIIAFAHLLNAIGPNGHLLIVTDEAQLKAPGPGGYVQQIVRLRPEGIAICRLGVTDDGDDICYRTRDDAGKPVSAIFEFANAVRKGEFPEIVPGGPITLDENNKIEHVKEIVKNLHDSGASVEDVYVLCLEKGYRKDNTTSSLNPLLREIWNPDGDPIANTDYRIGDVVINIQNDYADLHREDGIEESNAECKKNKKKGPRPKPWDQFRHPDRNRDVFNGYRGTIIDANDDTVKIQYRDPKDPVKPLELLYTTKELLYWIEPAYAMTVHKAEGGEAKHVIFAIPKGDKWIKSRDRSILYTAITRARESLDFLGPKKAFQDLAIRENMPPLTKFVQRYLLAKNPPPPIPAAEDDGFDD